MCDYIGIAPYLGFILYVDRLKVLVPGHVYISAGIELTVPSG